MGIKYRVPGFIGSTIATGLTMISDWWNDGSWCKSPHLSEEALKMGDLRALEADAFAAQRSEDWPAALALWTRILASQPNWECGYGYYNQADCYTRLGQLDSAEEAYRRAILVAPEDSLFSDTLESLVEARKLGRI